MPQPYPRKCQNHGQNFNNILVVDILCFRLREKFQKQKAMKKPKGEKPIEEKETNEHKGLLHILIGSVDKIIAARLSHNYSSYMAPNTLKIGPLDGLLWTGHSDGSWQDVLERLEVESKAKSHWRGISNSGCNRPDFDNPVPCTPYLRIVEMAASRLYMTTEQMIFEIKDYLSRKQPSHRGIQQFIETCSWAELADRLIRDKEMIEVTFGTRPQEETALKTAISEIEGRWFEPAFISGANIIMVVSSEAMAKTLKMRKRRKKKVFFK